MLGSIPRWRTLGPVEQRSARHPVTVKVVGSNPIRIALVIALIADALVSMARSLLGLHKAICKVTRQASHSSADGVNGNGDGNPAILYVSQHQVVQGVCKTLVLGTW
jgi:hypothetical protein